jgi:uncharacterized BrkB/YihY/UPF0761 family membrane protein
MPDANVRSACANPCSFRLKEEHELTEAAPAAPAPTATVENPGKTLGIVGLILAFFFGLNIVGLILSIVGLNKSRKVGMKNGPALAGIIVSIVTIVGGIIVIIAVAALGAAGFAAIAEACAGVDSGTVLSDGVNSFTCP